MRQISGGGGFGWKTIEQIATELDLPIKEVLTILKEAGVEAKKADVIREAAERNEVIYRNSTTSA